MRMINDPAKARAATSVRHDDRPVVTMSFSQAVPGGRIETDYMLLPELGTAGTCNIPVTQPELIHARHLS